MQTYAPDNPAMQALAANGRDGYLAVEREVRAELGLPPFGRLAAVILSAPSAELVDAAALQVAAAAPNGDDIELYGPAPAPLSVIRGRHRRRFLVKTPRTVDLSAYMTAWMGRLKGPSQVRISVDIDPYSFLYLLRNPALAGCLPLPHCARCGHVVSVVFDDKRRPVSRARTTRECPQPSYSGAFPPF